MKKLRLFLIILLILAIAAAALYLWQAENIKSVYYSAKYDDEKIDSLIAESNENIKAYLEENTELEVRPSTPTEEKLHKDGVITDDELMDILTGKITLKELLGADIALDADKRMVDSEGNQLNADDLIKYKEEQYYSGDDKPADGTSPNADKTGADDAKKDDSAQAPGKEQNKKTDSNTTASEYIAKMYVLKSSYTAQLDGLISSAASEYSQMSAEEKKNAKSTLMKYYHAAVALEGQCDAEVNGIVSKLESELRATGGDTSIVARIKSAYSSEKSLKKAQYLNKIR